MSRIAEIAVLVASLALCSSCMSRRPVVRDANGRLVFDESLVPHDANTPFYCFSGVAHDGLGFSECFATQPVCQRGLQEHQSSGYAVTSGCGEADVVYCYSAHASALLFDSSRAFCWQTAEDCTRMSQRQLEAGSASDVSACRPLDRSFQHAMAAP